MRSVNKVVLVGNLTRDPVMKETQNGQNVTTFGIATNREWNTSDGERKKSTEFHEIVAWAKLAEICNNFLKKGKLVYLEGYMKTRSWDEEDGSKRYRTEVVLKDLQSDLNIPVVVKFKNGEFEVTNKTIMRKKNFKTPDKVIKYLF